MPEGQGRGGLKEPYSCHQCQVLTTINNYYQSKKAVKNIFKKQKQLHSTAAPFHKLKGFIKIELLFCCAVMQGKHYFWH